MTIKVKLTLTIDRSLVCFAGGDTDRKCVPLKTKSGLLIYLKGELLWKISVLINEG